MVLIGDYMWLIGQYWTILNILDYWTLQDYNKLYRTIPDHIGLYWTRLYMTLHDYTRLYWNILVYSSKEFKGFKKSVTLRHSDRQTLRQTEWLTGPDLERHAPLINIVQVKVTFGIDLPILSLTFVFALLKFGHFDCYCAYSVYFHWHTTFAQIYFRFNFRHVTILTPTLLRVYFDFTLTLLWLYSDFTLTLPWLYPDFTLTLLWLYSDFTLTSDRQTDTHSDRHSLRQTQWLTGPFLERHAPLKTIIE